MNADSTAVLCEEIRRVFPSVEMPPQSKLLFRRGAADRHADILNVLEEKRRGSIDGGFIRAIHQELSQLSAEAWRWVIPHYLCYCLTEEAQYNRFETEYLIYNLGPELQFQRDTEKCLSLFDAQQIHCLIHFLEWCRSDEWWQGPFEKHIEKGISFLRTIESRLQSAFS